LEKQSLQPPLPQQKQFKEAREVAEAKVAMEREKEAKAVKEVVEAEKRAREIAEAKAAEAKVAMERENEHGESNPSLSHTACTYHLEKNGSVTKYGILDIIRQNEAQSNKATGR
jgi:cell division septum initiation protein DivIVA